jgi:2-acylglycerol O-acyltransferase 2
MVTNREGGFAELFPGIDFRVVCATFCFYIPIYRELLLGLGFADASRFSAHRLLESGRSIALVPGGATEALYCSSTKEVLYLSKRRGFIRLALQHGAALVPVYSFNETNVFEVYQGGQGFPWNMLDKAKRKFQMIFGISLPIVLNVIPRRAQITTVFGPPVQVPKVEDPKDEEVEKWLGEYTKALRKLYEENHQKYARPVDKPLEVM